MPLLDRPRTPASPVAPSPDQDLPISLTVDAVVELVAAEPTEDRHRKTGRLTWNGRGNDGRLWPDGAYTLTATAVDTNKQSVAISEVQAIVDSVDLTQDPPQLSINGQNYTLDKIKRIVRPTT
jgi:flagellar hook assembly protein FlgD